METETMKLFVPVLVALGLSTAAFAQAAVPDFTSLDADANGGITLQELNAAYANVTVEAFAAADADSSGELSADEYAAFSATLAAGQ